MNPTRSEAEAVLFEFTKSDALRKHARGVEEAMRAGMVMSLRRIVAVVALAMTGLERVPAARVRLNAITASTSHAALALNRPEGR